MEGAQTVLSANERATDGLIVRVSWYSLAAAAPVVGLVYFLLVRSDPPKYFWWVGISAAALLVPTVVRRGGWLPGSVKYLGPLAVLGAIVALAFTIHLSQSSWAIWLLPSLMAAFYFQPRVIWTISGLVWAAMGLCAWQFPETFPEFDIASLGYYMVTFAVLQVLIGSLGGKAARLLRRVEEEASARAAAYRSTQEAITELRHAAGRLVDAASDLEADALGASVFLDGAFADTVTAVVRASGHQQERATGATAVMAELNRSIGHIASGAQADAAAVGRGTALAGGMAEAVTMISQRAEGVLSESTAAANVAERGAKAVTELVRGIDRIRHSTESASGVMLGLRDRSRQIGGIAGTIMDIAEQTNLLALNAAIEAARVGEHGRGFAVVAQEVRKLAERSAVEASSIAKVLEQIQAGVDQAATAVEQTTGEVETGARLADTARGALAQVLQTTRSTTGQVSEIAGETRRQANASREMVAAFQQIEQVVQDTSAATEQMAAASEEVVNGVAAIGQASGENLGAARSLEQGAEQLRQAMRRITGVSEELSALVTRMEEVAKRAAV